MAKNEKKSESDGYSAEHIQVLEGLEAVRKRPGMYIGSTGPRGLHHLVWEVVDNCLDEAMAGHATEITLRLMPDSHVSVEDNGRGIPVDMHPKFKVSALELVMTKLHAGGKFGGGGYKVSGGLHGVGVSVVNALSHYTKAEVHRDGKVWVQEYKDGVPKAPAKPVGTTKKRGTTITFRPNDTIFETIEFDFQTILDHLRQQAYLTKAIKINIFDERKPEDPRSYVFYFEGGIASYVRYLNGHKEKKHDNVYYAQKTSGELLVEVALQYTEDYKETVDAFTNNIYNPDGGTHTNGFHVALTRTINHYARAKSFLKEKDDNLSGDDVREGLTAILSIKMPDPQFEGQTKAKLGNPEAKLAVETVFAETFGTWLEEHPRDGEAIIGKCILSARARAAAKMARETVLRKGALEGFTLPGKLSDCSSRDPSQAEIFIVEGDSAGGCFVGETKVSLADGRSLSFLELIEEEKMGKQNFCYSIQNDGSVGIEKILNVRQTKIASKLVDVALDNGEIISCTPEHKFMLRDGSYLPAIDLTPKMSLMPLYKKNVEMIMNPVLSEFSVIPCLTRDPVPYNHRVISVSKRNTTIPVYDLEVPHTHNFALASGVFVHNSAKSGRDREFQAILPLRGKILNVERARLDKILQNNELKSLIIALGTNIGEQFDLGALRYDRIIIATDADVDGAHIRTLLLTFFFRYFRELLDTGHIYTAQPPLFKVQFGKEVQYAYSDQEKEDIIAGLRKAYEGKKVAIADAKKEEEEEKEESNGDEKLAGEQDMGEALKIGSMKVNIQRYKGLGEMNPSQLWDTTMNPKTRTMRQISVEDGQKADELFDILMGNEVAPRRKFIEAHAGDVKNLDV